MKMTKIALATLLAATAIGANATTTQSVGQPYVGVKVGQTNVDVAEAPKVTTYGVYGGYNFDQNFGAEVEYIGSEEKKYTVNGQERELDVQSFGAYGTYRYHFVNSPLYIKGKLGVAKTDSDVKLVATDTEIQKLDKTSLAGGVGVGYLANQNFGLEAGYNYLNKDTNGWSVGASFKF